MPTNYYQYYVWEQKTDYCETVNWIKFSLEASTKRSYSLIYDWVKIKLNGPIIGGHDRKLSIAEKMEQMFVSYWIVGKDKNRHHRDGQPILAYFVNKLNPESILWILTIN